MWAFYCVVLSFGGTGLAIGRSLIQGALPKYLNRFVQKLIQNQTRSEGLIREANDFGTTRFRVGKLVTCRGDISQIGTHTDDSKQ
jgi:hypothetical protein